MYLYVFIRIFLKDLTPVINLGNNLKRTYKFYDERTTYITNTNTTKLKKCNEMRNYKIKNTYK